MALTNPEIILETDGLGTAGFTFSILGPQNTTTQEYPLRAQGENPKFTADYLNAPFVAGVTYLLEIKHPVHEPDGVVVRVTFDTAGNALTDIDPAEQVTGGLTTGTDLFTAFPFLRYSMGTLVTIETVNTFGPDEFNDDFDTGGL